MPNTKGIDLSDGIRILSGEINTQDAWCNASDMAAYIAQKSIPLAETYYTNYLQARLPGEQVRIHIFSASPLKTTCIVADKYNPDGSPLVIPDNWWAI